MTTPYPPTRPPGRHSIAAVLAFVDRLRAIAFDRSLPPAEAVGRIRDEFRSHSGEGITR
jgi:hypothetical protein